MTAKHLTIRTVRSMLTRSGVDYSALDFAIIDRSGTHTGGMYEGQYVEKIDVRITGESAARREARQALGERGLWLTPNGEYDDWSRGSAPAASHA
jgi:hypothetical protein